RRLVARALDRAADLRVRGDVDAAHLQGRPGGALHDRAAARQGRVDLGDPRPAWPPAELRRPRGDRHRRRARGVRACARPGRLSQPGPAGIGASHRVKFDVAILATEPLPDVVRQVQLAERLGYDTAWITDSHLVCRELWVTLSA